jgi:formylmethanofuran dehydrogenase subunit E
MPTVVLLGVPSNHSHEALQLKAALKKNLATTFVGLSANDIAVYMPAELADDEKSISVWIGNLSDGEDLAFREQLAQKCLTTVCRFFNRSPIRVSVPLENRDLVSVSYKPIICEKCGYAMVRSEPSRSARCSNCGECREMSPGE